MNGEVLGMVVRYVREEESRKAQKNVLNIVDSIKR